MVKNVSHYLETLQRYADDYFRETGKDRTTTMELAVWAIQTERWTPPPDLSIRKCREDFARALREQYITDEFGRPIRAKHAARVTDGDQQTTFWADIRSAPRKHMEIAFQQRREQIVGDCRQLKRDVDYYNEHRRDANPIQTCFDFRDDIEEGDFAGRYPAKI